MKAYLPKTYAKAASELALAGIDPKEVVRSLVRNLRKRKALLLLPRILQEMRSVASQEGKETISVKLSRPSSNEVAKHISQLVKKKYGTAASVSYLEDSSLIGGFSIQHGDDVTDYSLKTLLEKLHSSIDTKIV